MKCPTCGNGIAPTQSECLFCQLCHTFSVECIKKGISFPALQAILGHEHLSTTFIYSKMQPEVALDEFRKKF